MLIIQRVNNNKRVKKKKNCQKSDNNTSPQNLKLYKTFAYCNESRDKNCAFSEANVNMVSVLFFLCTSTPHKCAACCVIFSDAHVYPFHAPRFYLKKYKSLL